MNLALRFFLITVFCLKTISPLASQEIPLNPDNTPPLPPIHDNTASSTSETEWVILHLHEKNTSINENIDKDFGLVKEETTEQFPSNDALFGIKFHNYIEKNKEEFKKRGISLLRFVLDNADNFSSQQKKILSQVAKAHGMQIRFETVKIDWEKRQRELEKQSEKIIDSDNTIVDQEKTEAKKGFKKFWNDIYEPPTRAEVYGGITKGIVTLTLTMGAWTSMGMGPASLVFWTLTGIHILQEIFFGPYIKTYINFLYNKIKPKAGDVGVAVWGNIQGFVLFSFDKFLIYLAGLGTGPWDPVFLAGYWGMATVGSALGGLMPVGVVKLTQKGWISRNQGMLSMQALDLVMPIEGALLAFDSPYLIWVFSIHQAAKFSVYVAGRLAKQKGNAIFIPKNLYSMGEVNDYINTGGVPNNDLFESVEKTRDFLNDDKIARAYKVNFVKYIRNILDTEQELLKENTRFKELLMGIVVETNDYVSKQGNKIMAEINLNSHKSDFKNWFLNEPGDFESGYAITSWSNFWKNINNRTIAGREVKNLKKDLRMINLMTREIQTMDLQVFGEEFANNISKANETTIASKQKQEVQNLDIAKYHYNRFLSTDDYSSLLRAEHFLLGADPEQMLKEQKQEWIEINANIQDHKRNINADSYKCNEELLRTSIFEFLGESPDKRFKTKTLVNKFIEDISLWDSASPEAIIQTYYFLVQEAENGNPSEKTENVYRAVLTEAYIIALWETQKTVPYFLASFEVGLFRNFNARLYLQTKKLDNSSSYYAKIQNQIIENQKSTTRVIRKTRGK